MKTVEQRSPVQCPV